MDSRRALKNKLLEIENSPENIEKRNKILENSEYIKKKKEDHEKVNNKASVGVKTKGSCV